MMIMQNAPTSSLVHRYIGNTKRTYGLETHVKKKKDVRFKVPSIKYLAAVCNFEFVARQGTDFTILRNDLTS